MVIGISKKERKVFESATNQHFQSRRDHSLFQMKACYNAILEKDYFRTLGAQNNTP
jgi:hypothetical protein